MKLYLLNETLVTFEEKEYDILITPGGKIFVFNADNIPCNLTAGSGATPLQQEDCSRLAQSIKTAEICGNGINLDRNRSLWNLGVKFVGRQQPSNNTILALQISRGADVFNKIIDRCKGRNLQFQLCLEIFGLNGAQFTKWKTNPIPPEFWKCHTVFEVPPTKLPTDSRDIRGKVVGRKTVQAFVTVCFILNEPKKFVSEPEKSLTKQILEDGMFYDATIVAEDGTEINCHKDFLCARSTIFKAMLQSSFVEGQTSTIKMADMTEKAVRAFLRYIYYLDTQTPEAECQIALDLMKAADKYDIKSLVDTMKYIFLWKEAPWFTVDVALEIFVLARSVESLGEELKLKCVEILKKNPVQLQELEGFNRLFSEDPDAAKELCLLGMDTNQQYSKQLQTPKGHAKFKANMSESSISTRLLECEVDFGEAAHS